MSHVERMENRAMEGEQVAIDGQVMVLGRLARRLHFSTARMLWAPTDRGLLRDVVQEHENKGYVSAELAQRIAKWLGATQEKRS